MCQLLVLGHSSGIKTTYYQPGSGCDDLCESNEGLNCSPKDGSFNCGFGVASSALGGGSDYCSGDTTRGDI